MSAARDLPARPSLDSLRKQAKRLARDADAGNPEAVARVHAQLPQATPPLSHRDAQLVIAREYGFAGWPDLTAEVEKRVGRGLEWAVSRAKVAIHDNDTDQLRALLAEYPALASWRDDENGQTLLDSTTSYAMDCSDPERERTYTRPVAMEMLIDAGAIVQRKTWEHVINTGASGLLHLLARKNVLPRTLFALAALGDDDGVRALLEARDEEGTDERIEVGRTLLSACRFKHTSVALRLLERSIALDPDLGRRIDRWDSRHAFVEFLIQHPGALWQRGPARTPWEMFVVHQLSNARDRDDLPAVRRWLDDEPWVLQPAFVDVQAGLIMPACYENREAFIVELLDRDPALLHADPPPPSSSIVQALSYGNAHLIPLLTRIWPLPDDLPNAAGIGDLGRVKRWLDDGGRPAQTVLDNALAYAVLNHHYEIADVLLEHGADINTRWSSHEPSSILHELVFRDDYEAMQFLIDCGIDMTIRDYRWNSTAEGWARYGANNPAMGDWLAEAERRRDTRT